MAAGSNAGLGFFCLKMRNTELGGKALFGITKCFIMKKIIKPLLKILLVIVIAVVVGYFVYVGTLI